jgi:hypothetical protein
MEFGSVGWREGGVDKRVDTLLLRRRFFVSCLFFFDDCAGGATVCPNISELTDESKASECNNLQRLEMLCSRNKEFLWGKSLLIENNVFP